MNKAIKTTSRELVYITLANELRKRIHAARFDGDKLPPERVLAAEFKVNRITLRKALERLEREKLIYKLGTKGTFIRKQKLPAKQLQSKTIAFVLVGRSMLDRFHSVTMLNLEKVMRKWNHKLMFFSVSSPDDVDTVLRPSILDGTIDGIIFSGLVSPEIATRLYELDVFAVLLGHIIKPHKTKATFDWVYLDSLDYSCKAINYFIGNGKKEIALINGTREYPWFKNIETGYRETLKAAGIKLNESIISSCFRKNPIDAYKTMTSILDNANPDAVFVSNERVLLGVLDALNEKGMKLTVDIDVITVGSDTQMFAYNGVKYITFDSQKIASAALELLLRRLENPDMEIEKKVIDTHITTADG